jgi:hypothetical protein
MRYKLTASSPIGGAGPKTSFQCLDKSASGDLPRFPRFFVVVTTTILRAGLMCPPISSMSATSFTSSGFLTGLGATAKISFIFLCFRTSVFSNKRLCSHSGCATRGTGLAIYLENNFEKMLFEVNDLLLVKLLEL